MLDFGTGAIQMDVFPLSFTSTSRAEFGSEQTAAGSTYVRQRPCYDRLSACSTNYSLGNAPLVTRTTNDALLAHPLTRAPARQSDIGGWTRKDGSYKKVQEAIDSIRRGGGGGEGCLGISFNVVTGEEVPGVREKRRAIAGARRTLNSTAFLTHEDSYNVVTNRDVPHRAPPRQTAASLRRVDDVARRTRPW